MRKIYTLFAAALLATTSFVSCNDEDGKADTSFAASVSASTNPQDKNALVEHFTGINSEECAYGHRVLNGLMVTHPGKVFCINIHTGFYANGNYTTEFGTELENQSNYTMLPAGTVNRHVFDAYAMDTVNRGTAIPISYFANACDIIMSQSSDANLDARAIIDRETRELSVAVAVYYPIQDTNDTVMLDKLNVALLEDSIWGHQEGASTHNPTQYDFNTGKYCHMHMLRHFVTGQWGDDIIPVVGRQIRRVYKYTIPQQISGVDVNLDHLKVVVFLAKGKQEIVTACEARMEVN